MVDLRRDDKSISLLSQVLISVHSQSACSVLDQKTRFDICKVFWQQSVCRGPHLLDYEFFSGCQFFHCRFGYLDILLCVYKLVFSSVLTVRGQQMGRGSYLTLKIERSLLFFSPSDFPSGGKSGSATLLVQGNG